MDTALRPLLVVGGAVLLTLLVGWVVDVLLRRADDNHRETPLWGLLRRCRPPLQAVLLVSVLRGTYRETEWRVVEDHSAGIGQILSLLLIGSGAWLVITIASAVVEASFARYASPTRDPARVRRVRTQVALITRIVTAVVAVVALAAALLTFPALSTVGTSMLASAGIIGIVAGVAAQSTLGNLFAGFQIAFGDMVRIGDTVVVDGEWGVVEEVTLTFLAVRTWDERRITMPVSYFTGKPFENWSRGGAQMTGAVMFHLDHSTPLDAMRRRTEKILAECPAWDGRDWNLAVTDTTPSTIQVRVVVTAKDADDLWTVRCTVREGLVAWLAEQHPYALPRIATSPAVPSPREMEHPSPRKAENLSLREAEHPSPREVGHPSPYTNGDEPSRTGRG
ncbi:mechanosensitive ion channel domain-containing protein [Streptomyces sp. NPDC046316]|uniref:mechanosensitive ion channel family protein n=1 Tax=Streptomyces sp. NPDC046316 TaxID=3154494 RepID=UPI0033EC26C2